ncbi:hypothetical protein ABLT15_36685 [Paraburkholderia tropica]|uniref:hypothetical protein n=1 Tax=Paraburkholderia tropica TaxID=92647 RepID=UPI0032B59107
MPFNQYLFGSQWRVAVCITSFDRIDCALILQEIIKFNWPNKWYIVHATSSKNYDGYLEDVLILREQKKLTCGALDLLVSSIQAAKNNIPGGVDYIVHLEADTWIGNQSVVNKYLNILANKPDSIIAASSWSYDQVPMLLSDPFLRRQLRGLILRKLRALGFACGVGDRNSISTQFFIAKATPDFIDLVACIEANDDDFLEKLVYEKIVEKYGKTSIIPMAEREPVHPAYRYACDALSLATHHWPSSNEHSASYPGKKEWLIKQKFVSLGPHMERLLRESDLAYYNKGASRV